MNVLCFLTLVCTIWAIMGCARSENESAFNKALTLDDEIEALPDEWSCRRDMGPVSNNYVILDRVIAVTNVQERIRLAWKLFNHFRHTPEWYLEHLEGGSKNKYRHDFMDNCAWKMIFGTNRTPETVIAGWKMNAEAIRDLKEVVRLTGPEWQAMMRKSRDEKLKAEFARLRAERQKNKESITLLQDAPSKELSFAHEVRGRLFRFFYLFSGSESYVNLPDAFKPAFLEQLKRDFFIYGDITNAFMWKNFPPELKEALREVQERKKQQKAKVDAVQGVNGQ